MRAFAGWLILFLVFAVSAADDRPTPGDVLDRAIEAMGGSAAVEGVRELRVVWVGTQDSRAVYQGRFAEEPAPARRQETLILDVPGHRGALRAEGVQSDGTPSLWRDTILPGGGYSVNLKTQRTIERSEKSTAETWERWLWSIPQLALGELSRRRAALRGAGRERIEGRDVDLIGIDLGERGPLRIGFDHETGLLSGYFWDAAYVEGKTAFAYRFKTYRAAPGLGSFPSGYRLTVGERVFKDFDVFDARLAKVGEDPWLIPLPKDSVPILKIVKQAPAAEAIAPGLVLLRNVGGYNVLAAAVSPGCMAIVDTPAHFDGVGTLPSSEPSRVFASEIWARAAAALPGRRLCYIVPTHHHGDHIGAATALLALSPDATLVVSPGGRALAGRMAPGARIETVSDRTTLGEGDTRLEIYRLTGSLHVDDSLFAYFPARRIAFEADLTDYILASKRLRQFLDERNLPVDQIFGAHNSSFTTPAELDEDDPGN
jgi:glyoxylase-like metal-dependent hydrolase (beta-lactamase superfamily II)